MILDRSGGWLGRGRLGSVPRLSCRPGQSRSLGLKAPIDPRPSSFAHPPSDAADLSDASSVRWSPPCHFGQSGAPELNRRARQAERREWDRRRVVDSGLHFVCDSQLVNWRTLQPTDLAVRRCRGKAPAYDCSRLRKQASVQHLFCRLEEGKGPLLLRLRHAVVR